jgi:hypothetical protein
MRITTKISWDLETGRVLEHKSYDYEGPMDLCCGPSSQETAIEASQQSFMTMLMNNYQTQFANQQEALGTLNKAFAPVLAAGPNASAWDMPGGAVAEAALTSTAINTTAAGARQAEQAVAGEGAGRGASSGIQTGIQKQINAVIASQATGQLGAQELGIQELGQQLGRQQYNMAVGGEQALAGAYEASAGGAMGGANTAATSAYNMAETNAMAATQEFSAIAGGIGAMGGDVAQGFSGGVAGGGK